MKMKLGC